MSKKPNSSKSGFSLLEMILGIAFLLASIAGTYYLLNKSNVNAGVEQEQQNAGLIINGLQGAYSTQGGYEGLSNQKLWNLGIPGIKKSGTGSSALIATPVDGSRAMVRPATVAEPNDAFDLVYYNLGKKECIDLIGALHTQSYTIFVGETSSASGSNPQPPTNPGTQVQLTAGKDMGRLADRSIIAQACSRNNTFGRDRGIVAFRFYQPKASDTGSTTPLTPGCPTICAPRTETQTIPCTDPNQQGFIQQKRTFACDGGTPACPALGSPTSWTTVYNTCTATPPTPIVVEPPVLPPSSGGCDPYTIVLPPQACDPGYTGFKKITRTKACPSGSITDQVEDNCTPELTIQHPCEAGIINTKTEACSLHGFPAGTGGSVTLKRVSSCPNPYGSPVWGDWSVIGNTCSPSCLISGNCCTPTRQQQAFTRMCQAGQYGTITGTEERASTCATATSTPLWANNWYDISINNTCTDCPASENLVYHRWVDKSSACVGGEVGQNTWQARERRERTRYYVCPAGTTSLPTPSYSGYSTWAETGETRNHASTCTGCPEPETETETQWVPVTEACNPQGSRSWEKEQVRTRVKSYNCTAGTTVLPAPDYTAWSAWSDTGITRNNTQTEDCGCGDAPPADTRPRNCASGQYGSWTQTNPYESVAAPTCWSQTDNTWTPGSAPSGSCVNCPATVVADNFTWLNDSEACPSGQTGSITWQYKVIWSETTSYNCPAGTQVLPPATVTSTTPTPNGETRNYVNTCTTPPAECDDEPTPDSRDHAGCPAGTYGSWTQTNPYESVAPTECWKQTDNTWSPTTPPDGACKTCPNSTVVADKFAWRPRSSACPAGYTGTGITWEAEVKWAETTTTTYACPAGTRNLPTPVVNTTSSTESETGRTRNRIENCTYVCPAAPSPDTRPQYCPAGQYGSWTQTNPYESVAPTACWGQTNNTWSPGTAPSGACQNCPAPVDEHEYQWVDRSQACPAGTDPSGTWTWEAQQVHTRQKYYNCPAGTTSLPVPSYTSYGAWTDTGTKRNEVKDCPPVVTPCGAATTVTGTATTLNPQPGIPSAFVCDAAHQGKYLYMGLAGYEWDMSYEESILYRCDGVDFVHILSGGPPWNVSTTYQPITNAVDANSDGWAWPEANKSIEDHWIAEWVCYP